MEARHSRQPLPVSSVPSSPPTSTTWHTEGWTCCCRAWDLRETAGSANPKSGGLCGSVSLLLLCSGRPFSQPCSMAPGSPDKAFPLPAILLSSCKGSGSGRRHRDQIQAWAGVGENLPMPSWHLIMGRAQWEERPMNEADGKVTIHKTSKNKPRSKTAFFAWQFEDGLIYRKMMRIVWV